MSERNLSLFENDGFTDRNRCGCCVWQQTEKCPQHRDFNGRRLFDVNKSVQYCHRFKMTDEEKERRWQLTMDKLGEGLKDDEDHEYNF